MDADRTVGSKARLVGDRLGAGHRPRPHDPPTRRHGSIHLSGAALSMKIEIDTTARTLRILDGGRADRSAARLARGLLPISGVGHHRLEPEVHLRVRGMGRPIIQLPRTWSWIQEVIYRLRPDVIIETGWPTGGSLIYYASLCKAMGAGRGWESTSRSTAQAQPSRPTTSSRSSPSVEGARPTGLVGR